MVPRLSNKLVYITAGLIFFACTSHEPKNVDLFHRTNDEFELVWATKLPGKAGIYNDGLIGLPRYNDIIIFHSTYFTNQKEEDNRIHGLNMITGNIKWTFPEIYDKENPMSFWGVPVIHENLLITKMNARGNQTKHDRIICLNLDTREIVWKITLPESISLYCTPDLVSYNDKFYFYQRSAKRSYIFEGNIYTGDTCRIFTYPCLQNDLIGEISTNVSLMWINNHTPYLLFSGKKIDHEQKIKLSWNVFDIRNKQIKVSTEIIPDEDHKIGQASIAGSKAVLTCGRNVYCYDLITNTLTWHITSSKIWNYMTPAIHLSDTVAFMYGDNMYLGVNINTGQKLYEKKFECANANILNKHVILICRAGNLNQIDKFSGEKKITYSISNLFPNEEFSFGCKPHLYGSFVFAFGEKHAFCLIKTTSK